MDHKTEIAYSAFSSFHSIIDYYIILIENKSEIMSAERKRNIEKIESDEIKHLYSEELYFYFQSGYLDLTLKSAVINLFNNIEMNLRKIMTELKSENNYPIAYSDLSGSILDKSKLFFKNYGLKYIPNNSLEIINEIQKIRDCFVHCNGIINESRDKTFLLNLVSIDSHYVNNDGYIEIQKEYCFQLLNESKNIIMQLFKDNGYIF
jgi:hypothetical protein